VFQWEGGLPISKEKEEVHSLHWQSHDRTFWLIPKGNWQSKRQHPSTHLHSRHQTRTENKSFEIQSIGVPLLMIPAQLSTHLTMDGAASNRSNDPTLGGIHWRNFEGRYLTLQYSLRVSTSGKGLQSMILASQSLHAGGRTSLECHTYFAKSAPRRHCPISEVLSIWCRRHPATDKLHTSWRNDRSASSGTSPVSYARKSWSEKCEKWEETMGWGLLEHSEWVGDLRRCLHWGCAALVV